MTTGTISLRSLLDKYDDILSDIEIIERYFIENNKEYAALLMIPILAKKQADKIQVELDSIKANIKQIVDMNNIVKNKEIAKKLNDIIRYSIINEPLDNDELLYKWAKENIPTMTVPKLFYAPAIEYLAKYGIKFI